MTAPKRDMVWQMLSDEFRITVGYISAVITYIQLYVNEMENFPINARIVIKNGMALKKIKFDILYYSSLTLISNKMKLLVGTKRVSSKATPAKIMFMV